VNELQAKVVDLVANGAPAPGPSGTPVSVTVDSRFVDDLDYDSLRVVELLLEIERAFEIAPIELTDVAHLETVGEFCDWLADRMSRASANPSR
jgi:acyl carrier protein